MHLRILWAAILILRTNSCKSAVPPNLLPKQSLLRAQTSPRALTPRSASLLLGVPFRSLLMKCYSLILRHRASTCPRLSETEHMSYLSPSLHFRYLIYRAPPHKKLNSAAREKCGRLQFLQMREQMIFKAFALCAYISTNALTNKIHIPLRLLYEKNMV